MKHRIVTEGAGIKGGLGGDQMLFWKFQKELGSAECGGAGVSHALRHHRGCLRAKAEQRPWSSALGVARPGCSQPASQSASAPVALVLSVIV